MSQNGIRKAAAEDKEYDVVQKSPTNNVANRLQIIINKCYHGNMYDKHIIVGGQSSTALTITFVDAGTKSCTSGNKTDTNRVSTTRSVNQLETLYRNESSRDTNGFA